VEENRHLHNFGWSLIQQHYKPRWQFSMLDIQMKSTLYVLNWSLRRWAQSGGRCNHPKGQSPSAHKFPNPIYSHIVCPRTIKFAKVIHVREGRVLGDQPRYFILRKCVARFVSNSWASCIFLSVGCCNNLDSTMVQK